MIEKLFPKLKLNYNIAPDTTFGIRGCISYYLPLTNERDFIENIRIAEFNNIDFSVVAGGSNVVFPEVFDKLLIHFLPLDKDILVKGQNNIIIPANYNLSSLVNYSTTNSFLGLESLIGIPGTIGGAVVGNAGAYGRSIDEFIDWVEVLTDRGIEKINRDKCLFTYRDSLFKREKIFITRVAFKLTSGKSDEVKKRAQEIREIREAKYGQSILCPGSFFKNVLINNISKDSLKLVDENKIINNRLPAGYLLEASGAQGMSCGDIAVSDFHSNILINKGQGTYTQVRNLAQELQGAVLKRFGILLEEEVRYMI